MGIANKYNRTNKFNIDFSNLKDFEYRSLDAMVSKYGLNTTHKIHAMYINKKSKYGEAPVIVTSYEFVNVPKHMTDTVKEMLNDVEVVEAINKGKFGFSIYNYQVEGKQYYSINWEDLD